MRRVLQGRTKTALAILFVSGALAWTPAPVFAKVLYWTGQAHDHLFSNAGNWTPNQVPASGDSLIFGDPDHDQERSGDQPNNDIPNLALNSLRFASDSGTFEMHSQTPLVINSELAVDTQDARIYFDGPTVFGDNAQITTTGEIDFYGFVHLGKGTTVWQNPGDGVLGAFAAVVNFVAPIYVDGDLLLSARSAGTFGGAAGQIFVGDIYGPGNITAVADGDYSTVGFDDSGVSAATGTLFLTTRNGDSRISFSEYGFNGAIVIQNGDTAKIEPDSTYQPSQAGPTLTITQGSRLVLDGNDLTVSNLVLENVSADADPSVVDTGGNKLILTGSIVATVDNDHVHPTIKGHLLLSQIGSGLTQFPIEVSGGPEPGLELQASIDASLANPGVGFELVKSGPGTLLLSGNNSFKENIAVTEGVLQPRNSAALGFVPGAGLDLLGGNLLLDNVSISGVTLLVDFLSNSNSSVYAYGQSAWAGPVILKSILNVVANDPTGQNVTLNLSGSVQGFGGLNFVAPGSGTSGSGAVRLSGSVDNTYTGPTFVSNLRLELDKSPNIHAMGGPLIVGGGDGTDLREVRWLHRYQCVDLPVTLLPNGLVNLNDFEEQVGSVTFNGGRVEVGAGVFGVTGAINARAASSIAVIDGSLRLPIPSTMSISVEKGAFDPGLNINGTIFGIAEAIVKEGPGTLRFSGVNSFSSVVSVNEGILQIDNSGALGNSHLAAVSPNATLQVVDGFGLSIPTPLMLSGSGLGGEGVLEAINGATVTFTGPVQLPAPISINVAADSIMALNGAISGTGPITKTGPGKLIIGGVPQNTYSGDTLVTGGTLLLNKASAVPGNLMIGGSGLATVQNLTSFAIRGAITVDRGGTWDLNGQSEGINQPPLTLKNGGSVQTGSGIFFLPAGGDIVVNPGTLGSSTISGNIGLDPGPHHFTVSSRAFARSGPECTVSAVVQQTAGAADLIKDGAGILLLSGANTYAGDTVVNAGTLEVEGSQPQSAVQVKGGRLQGSGVIGANALASSGVVAPGSGVGILSCGNLNASGASVGAIEVNLNGSVPGRDYSQLKVVGTVNLAGMTLNASLGFTPSPTNEFVIINNDGADPVVGTFNGLPQGATVLIGGQQFVVSYTGGDGNDVVLASLSAASAAAGLWTNSLGGNWNDPANWNNHAVPNASNATITNNGNYSVTNNANVSLVQLFLGNPSTTLTGNGNFNLSGLFSWEAGSFDGTGTIAAQGGMHVGGNGSILTGKLLLNSAPATWSQDGAIYFGGGAMFSNAPSGTFDCAGNGSFENLAGSNLVFNAGLFRKTGGAGSTRINVPFINTGTVQVQSGTLILNNGGTNTGIILVPPNGTFTLGGGTHTFTSDSTITGGGNFTTAFGVTANLAGLVDVTGAHSFSGGTVNFIGNYNCFDDLTIADSTVNFNGTGTIAPTSLTLGLFGNLGGSNVVMVSGPITWTSSSTISGSTSIIAGGGMNVSGGVFLDGRTLVNLGAAIFSNDVPSSVTLANGAVLSNAPGATFDCAIDSFIFNSFGSNAIVNAGLFRKTGGSNETRVDVFFHNQGTVEVQSGVLGLGGGGDSSGQVHVFAGTEFTLGFGTHNFGPDSSITGAGNFSVSGGTANLAGVVNVSGTHTFSFGTANITGRYSCVSTSDITGGTAIFNGTGTIAPADLTLSGFGVLGGSNLVTVTGPMNWGGSSAIVGSNSIIALGGLNISGGVSLSGRTLVNLGAAVLSNNVINSLTLSDGAVLSNAPGATFDCAIDDFIFNSAGSNVILNAGLFRKTGGTNVTTIAVPFINTGIVESQTGALSFVGPFTIGQGGLIRLRGGGVRTSLPLQLRGGMLAGNGVISGAVANSGLVSPGFSPGQLVVAGDYTQPDDGILHIEIAGTNAGISFDQLIVSNTATLGGTLNVILTNGFYPAPNSSFTFLTASNVTGVFTNFNYASQDIGLALDYTLSNIAVRVTNTRPTISPVPDQTITNHSLFQLAVPATDSDLPQQTLSYVLTSSPSGARIDTNGVITWTPNLPLDYPSVVTFLVRVSDSGTPTLSASAGFRITILDPSRTSVQSLQVGIPGLYSNTLSFAGMSGVAYVTQYATNLPGPWFNLMTNIAETNGVWSVIDPSATNSARFYRAFWPIGP